MNVWIMPRPCWLSRGSLWVWEFSSVCWASRMKCFRAPTCSPFVPARNEVVSGPLVPLKTQVSALLGQVYFHFARVPITYVQLLRKAWSSHWGPFTPGPHTGSCWAVSVTPTSQLVLTTPPLPGVSFYADTGFTKDPRGISHRFWVLLLSPYLQSLHPTWKTPSGTSRMSVGLTSSFYLPQGSWASACHPALTTGSCLRLGQHQWLHHGPILNATTCVLKDQASQQSGWCHWKARVVV